MDQPAGDSASASVRRGPFAAPRLGLGRDIAVRLRDPGPPLAKAATLVLVCAAVAAVGAAVVPPPAGYVLAVVAILLFAIGGVISVVAVRNRDRGGMVVHLDRTRLELPRVAIVGPGEWEIPLADVASVSLVADAAGPAILVRTADATARIAAASIADDVSLAELGVRIALRSQLAKRGGRVRRSVLLATEAMVCLGTPEEPIGAVALEKVDGQWTILAVAAHGTALGGILGERPDARIVVTSDVPPGAIEAGLLGA